MKNKKTLIIAAIWVPACTWVVVAYQQTAAKPLVGGWVEPVIIPPRQTPPARTKTPEEVEIERREKEYLDQRLEELSASLERQAREGKLKDTKPIP